VGRRFQLALGSITCVGILALQVVTTVAQTKAINSPGQDVTEQPAEVGPDFRIWRTPVSGRETLSRARKPEKDDSRRIVELSTGMNYFDGKKWKESVPEFVLQGGEFLAERVQHQARINANLNVGGAVELKDAGWETAI